MPVSQEQLALIRHSFDALKQRMPPASVRFYDALFRRRPDLRAMFRDDLSGQGMSFMSTLDTLITSIGAPRGMTRQVTELGRLHARLGVTADMFPPMADALIDTLRAELDGLPSDTEAAWRAVFDEIAAAMIGGGGMGGPPPRQ